MRCRTLDAGHVQHIYTAVRLSASGRAGVDVVITSVASSLLRFEPASLPQAPRHPARALINSRAVLSVVYMLLWHVARRGSAINGQPGVLRHWKRTIFHTACRLCVCLSACVCSCLSLSLCARPSPCLRASHALKPYASWQLTRHEAPTFPGGRSVAPPHQDLRLPNSRPSPLPLPLILSRSPPFATPSRAKEASPRCNAFSTLATEPDPAFQRRILSQPETQPLALGICSPNPVPKPGLHGQA